MAGSCFGRGTVTAGWLGRNYLRYQTYQTAYGETRTLHLPDGSTVALNAHSALRVPRFGFTGGKGPREVLLTGEAYFSVTHRPDSQPFIVKTAKGFEVLVHGTKFTVSTHAYRARVMLQTGKVQVNYGVGPAQKQLMLRPGDLVRLDQPASPVVQHRVVAEPYVAWIRHRFLFDNMTLRDFGHLLSDTYGLKVVIPDPAVARRTLAGSFRADSADELLTTVSEIFDLQVAREGSTVRLTQRD